MISLKNKKYFLFIPLIFLFCCTDLKVQELDSKVVQNSGGQVAINVKEFLAKSYQDFKFFESQNRTYGMNELSSDEMLGPTRGTDWSDNGVLRQLHLHQWSSTHPEVIGTWNDLNGRIFRCNQILSGTPDASQAAQAKFIRAFFMSYVIDLYGQVPFREANEGVDVNPKVFTRTEAFDFAIKDLTEALPDLSETGPKEGFQNILASKAAAQALLVRLYLNKAVYTSTSPQGPYTFDKADMDKVIEYADEVTKAGYSLEDDYFKIFTKNGYKEIIFSSDVTNPTSRWHMTLHYNHSKDNLGLDNIDPWNGFTSLAEFYNKFEEKDFRKFGVGPSGTATVGLQKGFLVGTQYDKNGKPILNDREGIDLSFTATVPLLGATTYQGIRVIKYHPVDFGYYVLLRYGEVFLSKVEALFHSGETAKALTEINILREKRGATPLTAITKENILDERGRELYWEGIRRVDLIRFEKFTSGTWEHKGVTDDYRVLYPIPQIALDTNPNLKQNPGY